MKTTLIKRTQALLLTLMLLLSITACGRSDEPETTQISDREAMNRFLGFWQICDDSFAEQAPFVYLHLDPEAELGTVYDETGCEMGLAQCAYGDGLMTVTYDSFEQSFRVDDTGELMLLPDGSPVLMYITELPSSLQTRTENLDLSGKWYLNNEMEQYLEFSDTDYARRDQDGLLIEEGQWEPDYDILDEGLIESIDLYPAYTYLYPLPGMRAMLEDTMNRFNAYLSEEIVGTAEAEKVMQMVRVLNMQFVTPVEELDYPTTWTLHFYRDYYKITRYEKRPDENLLTDELSGPWIVTEDGILELGFENTDSGKSTRLSFDLNENDQTLELPFLGGKTFNRDPDYPRE